MLAPGTVLQDRYRIVEHVGKGGMGTVYKAVHTTISATYAIKVTQTDTTQSHISKAFESEANLLAQLRHPAMPRVTDYFSQDDQLFLVMDFVVGDDLATLLERQGKPFPVAQVLGWAEKLLDVLHYLHTQSPPVIHRDIKPHNLKLDSAGNIYLLDFGLARGAEGTLLKGYTQHYAPLEQFQGLGTDERGDIYSLGVTLHHLLTNIAPHGVTTRASAVLGNERDPQLSAAELNPQVPPAVSDVLTTAMAIRPEERYASAEDMRAALRAAVNGKQEPAVSPLPSLSAGSTTVVLESTPPAGSATATAHPSQQQHAAARPPAAATEPAKKSSPMPIIIGVITLLLVLGAGGGGAWFVFSDRGMDAESTTTPLTATAPPVPADSPTAGETATSDQTDSPVAVAPLADQIAFVSDRDGNRDIFVMAADGSNPQNLTSDSDQPETAPAISPDGTQIAFEAGDDIYVMAADGSNRTNLTAGTGTHESPAWSPDGSRIAFVFDDALAVMQADGSGRTIIADDTAISSYADLDWSPDGEHLVFEFRQDIYLINVADADITNLTDDPATRDVDPAWSPDGTRIAFASDRGGNGFDVFVMDASGGSISRVTTSEPWVDRAPAWSPDGTRIVFRSGRDRGNPEVYVINIDGSDPINLTEEPGADDTNPVWSP